MNDKIKLAEAMGWTDFYIGRMSGQQFGFPPDSTSGHVIPDPFTDANDDYAVLEWMRPDEWINSVPIKGPDHARWRNFIFELRLSQRKDGRETSVIGEGYKIGDYARVALEILK